MLAVEINLLTGRYVATKSNEWDRHEWPPHPARLYSAMVAAYAEADVPDPKERSVLEWFEALGGPSICCTDAPSRRAVVTSYVPVNDATVLRDQGRLYERIVDAERALAGAAPDGASTVREKARAKLDRAVADAVSDTRRMIRAPETATVSAAGKALELLPDHRVRQPRTYPTVVPRDDRVWYLWPDAEPSTTQAAVIDGLLERVARLGHSSSMVSCRITTDTDRPPPAYEPGEGGTEPIRVTAPGLLAALEVEYARHRGSEPRSLPAAVIPYRHLGENGSRRRVEVPTPLLGGQWIVLRRLGSRVFSLRQSLRVARGVREALISHSQEPVHEMVSGHLPGPPGRRTPPTASPHLAVVPLPNVGNPRADGRLLGVALVLPREASEAGRRAVLEAVRTWQEATNAQLVLGDQGTCRFEPVEGAATAWGLRQGRWCQLATEWASVTPVALDRHPGDLRSARSERRRRAEQAARESIARACHYAGLPEPSDVEIRLDTPWLGVPSVREFSPFRTETENGTRTVVLVRCSVHARLRFAEKVRGPVLIGAGRYYGYGLFAPVIQQVSDEPAVQGRAVS